MTAFGAALTTPVDCIDGVDNAQRCTVIVDGCGTINPITRVPRDRPRSR
jgi:hypothetical protein